MKGWLYYQDTNNYVLHCRWDTEGYNYSYKTKESAMEYIESSSYFKRWATKEEFDKQCFDNAYARMKKALGENDFKFVFACLRNNANKYSRKAFYVLTGNKLSATMKVRMEQLKELYKDEYIALKKAKDDREKELERKRIEEEENRLEGIIKRYISGEYITGAEFVDICRKKGIEIPTRTAGFCMNTVMEINKEGKYTIQYSKKRPRSKGFESAFYKLGSVLQCIMDT